MSETTGEPREESVEIDLRRAVEEGSQHRVCQCFRVLPSQHPPLHNDDSVVDTPLFSCPSIEARAVYEKICEKETLKSSDCYFLIRGLLWIPPWYDVVWDVAAKVLTGFQRSTTTQAARTLVEVCVLRTKHSKWTTLADLQTFLQESVANWLTPGHTVASGTTTRGRNNEPLESTDLTPRLALVNLAQIMLRPLINARKNDMSRQQNEWMLPLEQVLPSLLLLCDAIDKRAEFYQHHKSIKEEILAIMFPSDVVVCRLLPWFTIASQIKSHLQPKHRKTLKRVLHAQLFDEHGVIDKQDYPGLMQVIVSSFLSEKNGNDDEEDAGVPSWFELVLYIFMDAGKGEEQDVHTVFSTVETVLKSAVSMLSTPTLHEWVNALVTSDETSTVNVPLWVRANLLLLLLQSIQQSGSQLVSRLLSRALGDDSSGSDGMDLLYKSWSVLVRLASPGEGRYLVTKSGSVRRRKQNSCRDRNEAILTKARDLLDHICYHGKGVVVSTGRNITETETVSLSCRCTNLIHDCIFLGQHRDSYHPRGQTSTAAFAFSERAQLWVHAAQFIVYNNTSTPYQLTLQDVLLAIWVVVTTYVDIPASRTSIVRMMMQSFLGNDSSKHSYSTLTDTNCRSADSRSSLLCVTLGVLVRSICHLEETTYRNEDMREPLRPIVDNVFSTPLSKDSFWRLATALSPLEFARAAILSSCRKKLQSPFFGVWWEGSTTNDHGSKASYDNVLRALYGLCALLPEKDGLTISDEYGLEARMLLSDMIVLNQKPVLTVSVREWLFRHLLQVVQNDVISMETVETLLRSCLIRFLSFCVEDSDSIYGFSFSPQHTVACWGLSDARGRDTRQRFSLRDDVASLLRLITGLVAATSSGTKTCCATLLEARNHLIRCICADYSCADSHQVLGQIAASSERAAVSSLGAIFQCLVDLSPMEIKSHFRREGETTSETLVCHELHATLVQEEKDMYGVETGSPLLAQHKINKSFRPRWVTLLAHGRDTPSLRMSQQDASLTDSHMLVPLCDVLVEFLLYPDWINSEDDAPSIFKCVSTLVWLKSSFLSEDKMKFNVDTLIKTGGVVFDVAAKTFKDLFGQNLDDVQDLFNSIVVFSDAIRDYIHQNQVTGVRGRTCVKDSRLVVKSLWQLYLAIACEDSSKRLIHFLEEKSFRREVSVVPPKEQLHKRSFLLILQSSEDVDVAVRQLRLVLLSTLLSLLSLEMDDRTTPSRGLFDPTFDSLLPLSFWIAFVDTLSSDLLLGVKGESGGVDSRMFSTVLDLLEGATETILQEIEAIDDPSIATELWQVCRSVSLRLWEIVCSVQLPSSRIFRKTLLCVMDSVPSILRCLSRTRTFQRVDRFDELEMLFVVVFDQCIIVLETWNDLDPTAVWNDIAGADHTGRLDSEGMNGNESDSYGEFDKIQSAGRTAQKRVPSTIEIPSKGAENGNNEFCSFIDREQRRIRLPDAKALSWSFCCSLQSMEKIWIDSIELIRTSSVYRDGDIGARYGNSGLHNLQVEGSYCLSRHRSEKLTELSEIFRCVYAILGESKPSSDYHRERMTGQVTAVKLSSEAKLRLCSLLEKMVLALKRSIRSLSAAIRKPSRDRCVYADLGLAESATCLATWLLQDVHGLDLTGGTRRWSQAEQTKIKDSAKYTNGTYAPREPVVARLPKVISGMQELENALQKFNAIVKETTGSALQGLEEFVCQANGVAALSTDEEPVSSLHELVSRKVKKLSDSSRFGLALLDSDASDDNRDRTKKRKRSRKHILIEKQIQQEKRKRVPRSRNNVVDEMLQRDREAGHDTGNDLDDAYVDLEDFIVEG